VELTELVQRAVRVVDGGQGIHLAAHILADDKIRLELPRKRLCI
jgi:hypothetical protein